MIIPIMYVNLCDDACLPQVYMVLLKCNIALEKLQVIKRLLIKGAWHTSCLQVLVPGERR